ncbi:MAG: hypothetical protein D6732_07365, partial [Methanobacteriota archaeon]
SNSIHPSGKQQTIQITFLSPEQNQVNVALNSQIEFQFNTPVDTLSINQGNIKIFGDKTGEYSFERSIVYDNQNIPVGARLDPHSYFKVGERIQVVLTRRIRFADSTQFFGFAWEFTCKTFYGSGQFNNQVNVNSGSQIAAWHIVSGDLDNDNDIDIVTANPPAEIAVLLNDGDGDFSPSATYSAPGFPVFVNTADYNRDGFLDISVVSDSNLYVFFNNGDATFGAPDIYYTPHPSRPWERAWSIANADINRDGYIDIVVSNINGGSFDVFRNDSTGIFLGPSIYVTLPATPEHLITTDFDRDGDFDILFSDNFTHLVNYYLYENGGFPVWGTISTDGELNSIYCNDFTGEGDVDILLGTGFYSPPDDKIIMILREGGNMWTQNYIVLSNPNYAVGSDVNSDGFLDVICAHNIVSAMNNISILLNDGNGGLSTPNYIGDEVYSPFAITSADFNGDLTIDFAVANAGSDWISVFFNEPVSNISEETSYPIDGFELEQNYPNPFNPVTNIDFSLPHASPQGQARITLHVYDIVGQKVKTLVDGTLPAGNHSVQWDGTNDDGQPVASGVYFYHLTIFPLEGGLRGVSQTRKMVLLR